MVFIVVIVTLTLLIYDVNEHHRNPAPPISTEKSEVQVKRKEEILYNNADKADCAECVQQQTIIAKTEKKDPAAAIPELVDIENVADNFNPYYIPEERYSGYL